VAVGHLGDGIDVDEFGIGVRDALDEDRPRVVVDQRLVRRRIPAVLDETCADAETWEEVPEATPPRE